MSKPSSKIPSFLWIPLIVGAVILVLAAMLAVFFALGYVEGFASLIMLAAGWWGFRVGNISDGLEVGGFGVAVGVTFFAAMGMALDQPGNYLYNKPLEWLLCPASGELLRETVQRGVRGGGVSLSQSFVCAAPTGETLREIAFPELLAFRFVQYLLLGYVMLGLSRSYTRIKKAKTDVKI